MFRRVALLVSALAVTPLMTAAPAQALPQCLYGYQCTRTYFADNVSRDPVGQYVKFCDGTTETWGQVTHYVHTDQIYCGD